MEKSKFWKLFFGSGSVTLFNALRAFVINKLLAVFLPPAAFACVGQFLNLMMVGEASSSLALQNGWVNLSAQHKDNEETLLGVWRGGLRITTYATIFTCMVAVIFGFTAPLKTLLPGVPVRLAQAAIMFALPGMLATNIISITASVMNGLGQMKRWARIHVVASIWQMLWVALFLYTGRLSVLSIVATQSVIGAFFAIRTASAAGFSVKRIWSTALDIRAPWLSFAAMGLTPMILTPIALTIVRSLVGSSFGWEAAGIWQGVYRISDFFAAIYSAILGVILLPKITDSLSKSDFNKLFYPLLLRLVFVAAFLLALVYALRGFVVPLFLSHAYRGAADYLGFQLLGDFFRSISWSFAFVLIARRCTRAFVFAEIFSQLLFICSAILGIRFFEFQGPMVAYAFENFVFIFVLVFCLRRVKWREDNR